ncbi:hypothetical protein F4779DRAFT_599322 [Xylariaceae sp. FL0662B]|nr:hypothetical protein F4779DRAFT_599322 [Xylariaceae sp. FL0662B]
MAGNQPQMKKGGVGFVGHEKETNPDEEQLEKGLKHLDLLHVRCRELRTIIQQMLESLPDDVTPDQLYQCFMESIETARRQIKDFSTLYNSEESKRVLEQAKKSREANPKGIKPWRAKDHPDWLDVEQ